MKDVFGQIAPVFDTPWRIDRAKHIAGAIRARAGAPYKTAMEFGCGTGLIGMELIDAFERIEFIDSSPGMIEQVRQKIAGHKNASARAVDFVTERARGRSYDFIFSSMVIHHIKRAEEILKTLAGMLTLGGKLVIVDLKTVDPRMHINEEGFDGHHGFELAGFQKMMASAGLAEIESEMIFEGVNSSHEVDIPYALFLCSGIDNGAAAHKPS